MRSTAVPHVLLAVLFVWGRVGASELPERPGDGRRTLERPHDPVVVSTRELAAIGSRETASLRLYRFEGDRPVPIPVQFDPRDRAGDVVVSAPREFAFDDDDEMVFMADDAGDRRPVGPPPAGWEQALEIELRDPRSPGARAWAYLARVPRTAPAPVFEPYVSFDVSAQQARSAYYQVEYAPARNYFTGVRVRRWLDGQVARLARRTRMRGSPTFTLPFRELTLDFTEQNAIVELDGVRTGPVRAVRRARLWVELGRFFPDLPGGTAYTYHYRTAYLTPSRVSFSWLVLKALRDFHFENLIEFAAEAMPLVYFDPTRATGVVLDRGTTSALQTTDDVDWWVHSSDAGTMLHAFVIPPQWREWGITRGTVARFERDPAENEPVLAAGYTLHRMTRLREAGTFELLLASIVLPRRFEPGDEAPALAMLRAPLEVSIRPVS